MKKRDPEISAKSAPLTYLESLNQSLREAMESDPRVILIGEDLRDPYGGAFRVTRGLSSLYPDRVLSTPICEASIVGLGAGMALRGLRPVVEIMFGDFLTLAADQIVNHVSKFPLMYNGLVQVPLVIRTPMGAGRGYGPTHSQSLEKLFLGVPGLRLTAPSCFHHAGRLLREAIEESQPVLFLEHKLLYPAPLRLESVDGLRREEIPEPEASPTVLLYNYDAGDPDVTLITYGGTSLLLPDLLDHLRKEEIRCLTVVPSSLQPVPHETLVRSVRSSLRSVVVEEGTEGFSWGAEIACLLHERLHRELHRPVVRLTSAASVIPNSRARETEFLLSARKIESAILGVLT